LHSATPNFSLDAKRRAEEAETLRQAGAVVVSSLNRDEALRLILEQLAHVVPYDSASVLLQKKGVLQIVGGHGFRDTNLCSVWKSRSTAINPGLASSWITNALDRQYCCKKRRILITSQIITTSSVPGWVCPLPFITSDRHPFTGCP
jgi:hypothetical protein